MSDPLRLDLDDLSVREIVLGDKTLQAALADEHTFATRAGRVAATMTYALWAPPARAIVKGLEEDASMRAALRGIHLVLVSDDHVDAAKALGIRVAVVPALQKLEADGTVSEGNTLTGAAWGENVPAEMAPKLAAWAETLRQGATKPTAAPTAAGTAERAAAAASSTTTSPRTDKPIPTWLGMLMVILGLGGIIAVAAWKVSSDNDAKRDRNEAMQKEIEKNVRDAAEKSRKKPIPPT